MGSRDPYSNQISRRQVTPPVEIELSADVSGSVGAQDVECEAAQTGEVARFGSNAALVFEEGDVANVVAAVFDAPMLPDGGADGGG